MEKVSLIRKRKINENLYENEYSFLNRQPDANDQMNCLSLDLQRLRRNNSKLPSITSERKNLINAVSEKLRLLKEKIKQKQQERQKAIIDIEGMAPFPINYSIPMSIPLSMPTSMPMQSMQYPFPFQPHNLSCCHHCDHNQPKNQKKRQKKQKKQEKKQAKATKSKKKNHFRIYGYVIYFTIFIKHFTQQFTENRRKWFMDRYCKTNKGIIYQGSQQALRKLHELDFYQISQDAKQARHFSQMRSTVIDWEEQTNTALVPAVTIQGTIKSTGSVSQYITNFTQLLLSKVSDLILDEEFIKDYHEVFSAGSLDLNFMIDNLYLPEQIPFLFVHPVKGYLRLSYKQEIQLLLVKVMIKMVIFNFLLGLSKSKAWNKKEISTHNLAQYQIEEMWEIGRTIAIYLYTICKDLYLTGVKNLNHQSNFYELCKKFGVKQAKHLEELQANQNQNSKERNFQLIRNIKNYQATLQKINKSHRLNQHKPRLKQKIVDLLANLHQKLKRQERELYDYVRNMTLAIPYLIFEGIKAKDRGNKKISNYKILKPTGKTGSNWNDIYKGVNYSHSSEKSKSKSKNVKFDDSQENSHHERSTGRPESKSASKRSEKGQKYQNSMEAPQKKISNPREGLAKAQSAKKPFNIDTVNRKFDQNRQDRLRQKFRNILAKKDP